jgi:cytochrome b6-f complex iron-sulfur subunit
MERKQFLSLVGVSVGAVILQHCLSGCKSDDGDPSPNSGGNNNNGNGGNTSTGLTGNASKGSGAIDFTLDLTSSTYKELKTEGKALVVGDVIVAKTKDGAYIAVAKSCTHQGTTVDFESNNNRFNCSNHGSNFDITGKVLNGPATSPLTQYNAAFDATKNTLKVS